MALSRRVVAEFFGTFWLVFAGCGSAVLAAAFPQLGIGFAGVSLAFGLALMTMAYTLGPLSGCHLNPAVTIGVALARRFPFGEVLPYIVGQTLGGIAGAGVLFVIAGGGNAAIGGFASNGYGAHSPAGFSLMAGLLVEMVLTAFFVLVILGCTDKRVATGFAPLAIGLCLTLTNLVAIPVTNASMNPARSTATAVYVGGWALSQLWAFWVAPIAGGIVGSILYQTVATWNDPVPEVKAAAR